MRGLVVFELMFLTYEQLPPSIIVGTRGEAELTALECDWKTQKNKAENWCVHFDDLHLLFENQTTETLSDVHSAKSNNG